MDGTTRDDERSLIMRARSGDEDAFADLVRMHQARLRMRVASYLIPREDVCDIVQEAFVDAYRHLASFDAEREFWPWLWVICRNRMIGHLRDRRRRRQLPLDAVGEVFAERLEQDRSENGPGEAGLLRICMEKLQASHRQLLDMRYQRGLRVKDIASSLGKSETALSMMLGRIRDALLACMRQQAQAAEP